MNRAFWTGLIDRAAKSFGQGVLVTFVAEKSDVFSVDWKETLGIALGYTVVSVATSLASAPIGDKGTSSFLPGGR